MKNILKIVFVIIGTMIGAGFASGKEIYLFFFSFGIEGIIGLLISAVITGITIYKTLEIINKNDIKTYKEFIYCLGKSKNNNKNDNKSNYKNNNNNNNKNKKIGNVINVVVNSFILVSFFIMIAGFGTYFNQTYGIPKIFGGIALAIFCFFVFMTSTKGIVKVNSLIVPILIITVLIIGITNILNLPLGDLDKYIIRQNNSSFILSSITYSSYNSILLIPVLITLRNYLKDKKQILKITVISSFIILILSSSIFFLFTKIDVDIKNLEMPAVYMVEKILPIFKNIYGIIILGSIITTAVSLGASFLQNVSKSKKSYPQIALIMCITSVLISNIGFSNLVATLDPIFGYLGLIQIFMILRE